MIKKEKSLLKIIVPRVKIILEGVLVSPEKVFAILATIFGLISIVVMPINAVPDEQTHFIRAFQMSEGKFFPRERIDKEDGGWTTGFYLPVDLIDKNYASAGESRWNPSRESSYDMFSNVFNPSVYTEKIDFSNRRLQTVESAEPYFPVVHLPQAIGVLVGRLIYPSFGVMHLFGRLFNLLFYVLAMFFIIKRVIRAKWVYVVIALFPMIISHAASFSVDTIAAVSIFGLFMMMQNLLQKKKALEKKDVIWLLVFALMVVLVRPTNIVLLLPLALLPKDIFAKRQGRTPDIVRKWLFIAMLILVIVAIAVAWQVIGTAIRGGMWYPDGVMPGKQISWILSHPIEYVKVLGRTFFQYDAAAGSYLVLRYIYESPGAFTWNYFGLPGIVYVWQYILLIGIALSAVQKKDINSANGREAATSVVTYLCVVVAFATALYAIWTPVGHEIVKGLQGRYFSPMFIVLVPTLLWLKKYVSVKIRSEYITGVVVFCGALVPLVVYLLELARFYN
jgi:uncharacterized membrane protein